MSLKLKIVKINNSYESEPSSGCGSSIGEPNDFSTIYDDNNLNFHYIEKPPSYDNEVTITTSTTMAPINASEIISESKNYSASKSASKSDQMREVMFGIPVNSSQESSFEGFGSSPFDKLQRIFYPKQLTTTSANDSGVYMDQQRPPPVVSHVPSPGKNIFTKFYDIIIEENSCNAVDMQMSNDPNVAVRRISSISSTDGNPSSELSFNGRIKSLTKKNLEEPFDTSMDQQRLAPVLEVSLNVSQQQLSESYTLKKYSNEKSPDLFGDDEDEEEIIEEVVEDVIEEVAEDVIEEVAEAVIEEVVEEQHLVVEEVLQELVEEQPQQLVTITEHHPANLNESHQNVISCFNDTNENNSINFGGTDSSFVNDDQTLDCSLTQMSGANSSDSYTLFRENCHREREMLRRIRKCLAGVLPPPSVTIPQLDMFKAVSSRKDDILNYFNRSPKNKSDDSGKSTLLPPSLFRPTHTLDETKSMPWRDILSVRQHGLSYNLNKASENNEYLSLSIIDRFIGAETATSYTNSPSSAKKRSTRMKLLCQSPGNRLSHLAKRRAIFSSAHLATTSQKSSTLMGPQIMLDKSKKIKNRRKATPKRMTPGSKKKSRKTPSSSARKRLFRSDIVKPGPSRETSKRALFQSPAKQVQQKLSLPRPPVMKPELANRVEKSKRALLFTPEKQEKQMNIEQKPTTVTSTYFAPSTSKLESLLKRKRNTIDDVEDAGSDEMTVQCSKKARATAAGLTPRALKKSQSFCIGAGTSSAKHKQLPCASFNSRSSTQSLNFSSNSFNSSNAGSQQMLRSTSVTSVVGSKLQKSYSDTSATSNGLTENQKKKLLWAVSQALQERKITAKHESFKQYASILARVVRRIFQEYYQKGSTSNSETMLRLAKKYVYPVTGGSTADDVYLQAKAQIDDTKRPSAARLSGYIGPEEYQQIKDQQTSQSLSQSLFSQTSFSHKGSTQNIFTAENSFDSFGLISQPISGVCSANTGLSQSSFLGQISQDVAVNESSQSSNSRSGKKTIDYCASLHNSSSKSNLYGGALRENMDCELRRSAQKNFTGKDQRNMSPYAGNGGSAVKAHTQLLTDVITNSAKARRQISFDS